MIDQLIAALGTEVGLTNKEIADVIWLALQMQSLDQEFPAGKISAPVDPKVDDGSRQPSQPHSNPPSRSEAQQESGANASQAGLYNPDSQQNCQDGFGAALMLKVPDARSLREPLSLARSLKPLLRKVTTGYSTVLDEAATVERIANEGIWIPVLKPALEPWLDLALVVDESVSMQIWQRTIVELQRLLTHYGVFRDVRVWGLVTDEHGLVQLRPGIGAGAKRQSLRRPSELIDPSGRRLILVATDCVSAIWRDGAMLPTLKQWVASGPMAIVQMLPEWLWARTGLGFTSAVRLHSLMPGLPNQQLVARELSAWDDIDLEAGIKVPVVTLEPGPFVAWSEMVAGKGGAWSPGFVFEAEAQNGHAQARDAVAEVSVEQRVQRFRVTASPMARRLAGLLAAAPVISLPVVRIIQERLLKESRQVHVAEVFLGGLLKPLIEIRQEMNPDAVQYEFWDGVRDALMESVTTSDSVNVLDEVSRFVAERLGLSLDAFAAVLRSPGQAEDQELAGRSRPFAMVTAQVLRKLGGEYAAFAEELERSSQVNALIEVMSTADNYAPEADLLLEPIVAEAVIERIFLWEQGNTQIYALHTDRPWSEFPFNALVIPVGATGGLGSFGLAFEEFFNESELGDSFLAQLIYNTMRELNQTSITSQQPLLIPLDNALPALVLFRTLPDEHNRYLPLRDNPTIQRFIICATVDSIGGMNVQNTAIAAESILRLAEEQEISRIILPLLGTGANGLPIDEVATAMLHIIRSQRSNRITEITFVDKNTSTIEAIARIAHQLSEDALLEAEARSEDDIQKIPSQVKSKSAKKPIEVFFSYSREDKPLRDKLEIHLSILKRQGIISAWHDRQIIAGSEWEEEIDRHMHTADVILLLISPDFVSSEYCHNIEIPEAMERYEAGEASVVPILLRPVAGWKKLPFAKLQVYPSGGKPITQWNHEDDAFLDVGGGIVSAVEKLLKRREQAEDRDEDIRLMSSRLETEDRGEDDIQEIPSQVKSKSAKKPIEVFFSYSREDKPLRDKLEIHLSSLKRQGVISAWHDRQIVAGSEWEEEIDRHMRTADIILLLISPNFVASRYCYDIELPDAIARHEAGDAYVIPILLRPVAGWKRLPFAKLQVYPSGGKPITQWTNQDIAFVDVVEGIEAAVKRLLGKRKEQERLTAEQARQAREKEEAQARLEQAQLLERQRQEQIRAEEARRSQAEQARREAQAREEQAQRLQQQRQDRQSLTIYVTKRKLFGSGERTPLLDMVAIPGGKFWMGSPDGEGHGNENPRHKVTIAPFYISKYPITQKQYQTVVDKNPSHFRGENRPVESVAWWDAVSFCEALSNKNDRQFTLPSEAQWEYACRAGTITSFYFGEIISMNLANYNGNFDDFVGEGMYREQTTNVGIFPANAFGLYDMHGNVWEWCADHWHDNYDGAPNDGSPWLTGSNSTSRLIRGGSWLRGSDRCRSASRFRFSPNAKDNSIGFRVICI